LARKRRPAAAPEGGDLLLDLLTLPVLGAPRLVHWIAGKIAEEVERQEFDEDRLQGQLFDLQTRHELGEIGDEEYSHEEEALLKRLSHIRQRKQED
jgi:hypothetical protein